MSQRNKLSRYVMYNNIETFFSQSRMGKCLLIGEGKKSPIYDMFPDETEKISTDYPEVDMINICYPDGVFDYIVADQVLEHVKYPWKAVEECRRVLKSEGYLILTSCFLQFIHGCPYDYWRFTPDGLKILCENYKSIEMVGGWGSLKAFNMVHKGRRGEDVPGNKELKEVAKNNDDKYPVLVWIIARK